MAGRSIRDTGRVWTTSGPRAWKEITPGDHVFSLDEAAKDVVESRVVVATRLADAHILGVTAGGRTVRIPTATRLLVLRDERKPGRKRRRWAARWVPVYEVGIGELVAVATDLPEFGEPEDLVRLDRSEHLPALSTVDVCWFSGLFLGDGYVHRRGAYFAVEIAVDPTDTDLIAEIVRVAHESFSVEMCPSRDGLRLVGRASSALVEWIDLNGLAGNAHSKRLPEWAFRLPLAQRLALLAGYADADGYVRASSGSKDLSYTSVNADLLGDVKELAAVCGITSGRVTTFTGHHPHDADRIMTGHRLQLSGRFDRIPCRSPRRVDRMGRRKYVHTSTGARGTTIRPHTSDSLGYVRIRTIHDVGIGPSYGIVAAGHANLVVDGVILDAAGPVRG